MGRPRKDAGGLFRCVEAFGYTLPDGSNEVVTEGQIAEAGAEVLKGHEWAFKPLVADYTAGKKKTADDEPADDDEPAAEEGDE